jgi:hypothetical protein
MQLLNDLSPEQTINKFIATTNDIYGCILGRAPTYPFAKHLKRTQLMT